MSQIVNSHSTGINRMPAASAAAPPPTIAPPTQGGRTGKLRNGNPRGNPNLAPRCGARTRAGCACRAPAMANGRCRMHGGKCTGPRTAEGMARMIAAKTTHGRYAGATAPQRVLHRHVRAVVARHRILCTATLLLPYLPPGLAGELAHAVPELSAPPHPEPFTPAGSPPPPADATVAPRVRAAERAAVLAEREAQAVWRAGIAFARTAKCAARIVQRAAREARRRSQDGEARGTRNNPMQRENARRALRRELMLRAAGLRAAPVAHSAPAAPPLAPTTPPDPTVRDAGALPAIHNEPMQREPAAAPSPPPGPGRIVARSLRLSA
jgi:hypothetical protein